MARRRRGRAGRAGRRRRRAVDRVRLTRYRRLRRPGVRRVAGPDHRLGGAVRRGRDARLLLRRHGRRRPRCSGAGQERTGGVLAAARTRTVRAARVDDRLADVRRRRRLRLRPGTARRRRWLGHRGRRLPRRARGAVVAQHGRERPHRGWARPGDRRQRVFGGGRRLPRERDALPHLVLSSASCAGRVALPAADQRRIAEPAHRGRQRAGRPRRAELLVLGRPLSSGPPRRPAVVHQVAEACPGRLPSRGGRRHRRRSHGHPVHLPRRRVRRGRATADVRRGRPVRRRAERARRNDVMHPNVAPPGYGSGAPHRRLPGSPAGTTRGRGRGRARCAGLRACGRVAGRRDPPGGDLRRRR